MCNSGIYLWRRFSDGWTLGARASRADLAQHAPRRPVHLPNFAARNPVAVAWQQVGEMKWTERGQIQLQYRPVKITPNKERQRLFWRNVLPSKGSLTVMNENFWRFVMLLKLHPGLHINNFFSFCSDVTTYLLAALTSGRSWQRTHGMRTRAVGGCSRSETDMSLPHPVRWPLVCLVILYERFNARMCSL